MIQSSQIKLPSAANLANFAYVFKVSLEHESGWWIGTFFGKQNSAGFFAQDLSNGDETGLKLVSKCTKNLSIKDLKTKQFRRILSKKVKTYRRFTIEIRCKSEEIQRSIGSHLQSFRLLSAFGATSKAQHFQKFITQPFIKWFSWPFMKA